jgi:hypothetical protein
LFTALAVPAVGWAQGESAAGQAQSEPAVAGAPGATVVDRVGHAIERGATAAAHGIERGAQAASHGIQRGAEAASHGIKVGVEAAARGIEHGAQATARAAGAVARKVDSSTATKSTEGS